MTPLPPVVTCLGNRHFFAIKFTPDSIIIIMKVLIFIAETRGRGLGNLVELNYQILKMKTYIL